MSIAEAPIAVLDARPVRAISPHSVWDQAVATRDQFAATIRQTLDEAGIEALVLQSQAGNYPPWVRLEAWLPAPDATDPQRRRVTVELVVDAAPYREQNLVFTARATRGNEQIAVNQWPSGDFGTSNAREWTLYALGRGGKPSNYHPVRDALIAMVTAVLPFVHGPHHNPIAAEFRNALSLNGAKCVAIVSAFLAFVGLQTAASAGGSAGVTVLALALAGFVGSALIANAHTNCVAVPKQPTTVPPRNLVLVDSWHTVISGLGSDYAELKRRIAQVISAGEAAGIRCAPEIYSYRTPYGYEQRDRLVVTKGQSVVHLHVYPFADDIYIGWQAHLNCTQWGESAKVSHRVAEGVATEFRDLRPTGYVPNQFDLIDLSSLSELIHRRLEQEIKRILTERDIDQEIDFEIIRGERGRALDRARQGAEPSRGGLWGRITRAAAAWEPRSETEVTRSASAPASAPGQAVARGRFSHVLVWSATPVAVTVLTGPLAALAGYIAVLTGHSVMAGYSVIHYGPYYRFSYSPVYLLVGSAAGGFLLWYGSINVGKAVGGAILLFLLLNIQLFGFQFLLWVVFSSYTNVIRAGLSQVLYFVGASLSAGCYLLAFSIYFPVFREVRIWVITILLWAGGFTLAFVVQQSAGVPIGWITYFSTATRVLAFGFLGYQLQRAAIRGGP